MGSKREGGIEAVKTALYIAKGGLSVFDLKLAILGGSAARWEDEVSDLDIAVVLENKSPLFNKELKRTIITILEEVFHYDLQLFTYSENYINQLIEEYIADPEVKCMELAWIHDRVPEQQVMGWPLAWIFDEQAKKILNPYACFQTEIEIIFGENYLERLRTRVLEGLQSNMVMYGKKYHESLIEKLHYATEFLRERNVMIKD